jgi:hypothetical protein
MLTTRQLLSVLMLMLCSLPARAQGAFLEKGVNGFGAEGKIELGLDGISGVGFVGGYSIAGILDVGGSVEVSLGELGGLDSTDLRTAIEYRVNVVKQSQKVPFSLQLAGSYGINRVFSDYLDSTGEIRRGTGYTVGLVLATNIRLTPFWLVRLGVSGDYGSTRYVTLPEVAGELTEGTVNRTAEAHLGGTLGFLFVLTSGTTLAIQGELRVDKDLAMQVNPILAIAFPQR